VKQAAAEVEEEHLLLSQLTECRGALRNRIYSSAYWLPVFPHIFFLPIAALALCMQGADLCMHSADVHVHGADAHVGVHGVCTVCAEVGVSDPWASHKQVSGLKVEVSNKS